ncbi:MAG TPA: lipocalin family protein [Gemmatales bacterium]|nr:lipocalin family protein [Gemmatales bacterium]
MEPQFHRVMLLGISMALILFGNTLHAQEKYEVKQLLGKWEPADLPAGFKVVMEFKKDDKFEASIDAQGRVEKVEGTYKLQGNVLKLQFNKDGKEESRNGKILKLNDKELTIKDEETGEEETMKKITS